MYDAVVLSGGSTSAMLILGRLYSLILKQQLVLKDVKLFCGTSAGAIICLLLCLGLSPDFVANELETSLIFKELVQINLRKIFSGRGIFSLEKIENEVRRIAKLSPLVTSLKEPLRMKHLSQRLVCASFDFESRLLTYFDSRTMPEIDPVQAVIASSAIPFLFEPYIVDGKCFVDGGIIDNFPLEKAINLGAKDILGIIISKRFSQQSQGERKGWSTSDILDLMFVPSENNSKNQINSVPENIKLDLHKVSSSVPFYSMTPNQQQIGAMFTAGMISDDESCTIM